MDKRFSMDNNDKSSIASPIMQSTSHETISQAGDNLDNVENEVQKIERRDETKSFNNEHNKNSLISSNNCSANQSSGPQIFVVRPLPSRTTSNNRTQEPTATFEKQQNNNDQNVDALKFEPRFRNGTQFSGNAKIPDDYSQFCKDHDSVQNELSKENEYLQAALSNAYLQLNEKDVEFQSRIATLNQSYGRSINEMKILLTSQRKLGNRWKEEMTSLTQVFETTIRDLSAENKQLKRLAEKLRTDLKDKSMEAKEAKEMNGIYSARITKMERKFKKLRDQDEESYIEMTF